MTQLKDLTAIKENVATLVEGRRNDKERLDRIIPYLEEGYRHRTEVISRLSVIESNVKTYQADCDTDRIELNKRIGSVEKSNARQAGINTTLAAVVSGVMVVAGWFVDRVTR